MKICPKCGARYPDEAVFCKSCGTKMDEMNEAASGEAQPQLASEEVKPVEKEASKEVKPEEEEPSEESHAETPAPAAVPAKKKKFPVVPVAIGGAALIAAAAAVVAVNIFVIRPSKAYEEAKAAYEAADYEAAASQFESMGDYKDSKELAAECVTLMHYENGKKAFNNGEYDKAVEEFTAAGSYKDSADMIKECGLASHYAKAMHLSAYGNKEKAVEELILAGDYKDSKQMIYNLLIELGDKAAGEEDYAKASDFYQKAKTYKEVTGKDDVINYGTAVKAFNEGKYEEAIPLFTKCNGFGESEKYIEQCYFQMAEEAYAKNDLLTAAKYYRNTGKYVGGGTVKRQEIFYGLGKKALEEKDYDKAAEYLSACGQHYEDVAQIGKEAFYYKGNKLLSEKDFFGAAGYFELAGNYKDSKTLYKESYYRSAIDYISEKMFDSAKNWLEYVGKYKYSQDLSNICDAELAYENKQISKAASLYAKVSKKIKISGFNVQARKAAVITESAFAKASGEWTATSNNTFVKHTKKTRRYKKWKKWYLIRLMSDQYIDVEYSANEDGTFNLEVKAEFCRFMNFAWSQYDVETDYMTVEKEFKNLKKMPSKLNMGSGVTIKYSKGKYTLVFSKKVKSGSSTTQYKATVKFKKSV